MVDLLVNIAVEGILKKVLSIATNEVALAWGCKEKLNTLREKLDMIRAKLRDADKQKGEQEAVMVWLKKLKDLVGEADDVLDEVQYEMLRREVKKRDRVARKVPCFPNLKKFAFRREIGHKIENISNKLDMINKLAIDLGLHDEHVGLVPNSLYRDTDSLLDEYSIVGRENEARYIIELLTISRKEEKLTIVPIVGMGGVGKTSLAKSVFNDRKIVKDFEKRAWLCVSVTVNINTLLAKICESLTGEKCKVHTREILIRNLHQELGGKRYLLVLDDVWDENEEHWDDFRSCMLKVNSSNGSGILVTGRNLDIGTNDMTKDSIALKGLSDNLCSSIFNERAFGIGRSPIPELEVIGLAIVKKCRGLPLVVKLIGSMLSHYIDKKEKWLSIKDSKVWDLEGRDGVLKTLKLSFDNLPNSIAKQCFAYCSIFPKDTLMKRERLIQLWMALGFVQADETRNMEMEDVGNNIFQTLVSSSLFQDVKMDEYGYIVDCKMHDLVHDLSLSLSTPESLCLVGRANNIVHISHVKHLAVYDQKYPDELMNISSDHRIISLLFNQDTGYSLRGWHFLTVVGKSISFQHFKCLRILSLIKSSSLKVIHDSIGELVHLRYLDLSYSVISALPKSICKLYSLQTLVLDRCILLKDLPKDMKNLISLRHLICDKTYHQFRLFNVGQLTSLRTLSIFLVGREMGYQIEELGHLKHLGGKLSLRNLQEISSKEDAAKADLSGKNNLYDIEFRWSGDDSTNRNDKDVLEGLQPHANVKRLEISGFSGDDFPPWVRKMAINIQGKWTPLEKLVDITLSGCRTCLNLPTLGNLPLLRNLVLSSMDNLTRLSSCSGERDDVTGSRKPLSLSLRSLVLARMKSLENWTDAAMNSSTMLSPVLEKLDILYCPKIIHLDEYQCHPLVSLKIFKCENFESIRSLQGLTSLEDLSIICCQSLVGISDMHNQGHSLKTLAITNCNKLTCLPSVFDCLDSLEVAALGPFSNELHSFPCLQNTQKLSNHLHTLVLTGWAHWVSIPEEIKHLTALTKLTITEFGIQEIPIWLTNMSSIREMSFVDCSSLAYESVSQGAPREANSVYFNRRVLRRQGLVWVDSS